MSMTETLLPKTFHSAVERWRDLFLPDYGFLMESWDRYFPREPRFRLCAFRECGMCGEIECGEKKGEPKHRSAAGMVPEQAGHLYAAIRAQASTEFGSIQQHQLTLSRAQEEEEQVWILRMMAEELRHGYQMLHLLVEDDWSPVAGGRSNADLVEEILQMRTGSHVLGAFNIDFDSFVDNVVFCALIDRVGKYQLAMQKISAYAPMAESMPQMLREEAFHLAAGVVPLRRWVERAATGSVFVSMEMLQKVLDKWVPRGLEMFGDERGGGTNVRWGLKPMANAEAQDQYYQELEKMVRDLNLRFLRARLPKLTPAAAEALLDRLLAGGSEQGLRREDLLSVAHKEFFRRRGVPAFRMVGRDGRRFTTRDEYVAHLTRVLPESYLAGRDFRDFLALFDQVVAGQLTPEKAAGHMPALRRVGGVCSCSKGVRWVVDEPEPAVAAPESGRAPGPASQ